MNSHGNTYGLSALLPTLLILSCLAVSGAEAQTRSVDGGTAPRSLIGLSKERTEVMARHRDRVLAEQSHYRGTRVSPNSKAIGDRLALQTRIASLLSEEDFVPEPRKGHFRSMSESKYTPITGWDGTILNVAPDRNGMVVTVEFRARSVGGFCNFSTTTERYRFADGRLRFLDLVYTSRWSTWN